MRCDTMRRDAMRCDEMRKDENMKNWEKTNTRNEKKKHENCEMIKFFEAKIIMITCVSVCENIRAYSQQSNNLYYHICFIFLIANLFRFFIYHHNDNQSDRNDMKLHCEKKNDHVEMSCRKQSLLRSEKSRQTKMNCDVQKSRYMQFSSSNQCVQKAFWS